MLENQGVNNQIQFYNSNPKTTKQRDKSPIIDLAVGMHLGKKPEYPYDMPGSRIAPKKNEVVQQ